MAWYITKDHIGTDAVGKWNGRFIPKHNNFEFCKKVCKFKFRMLDDDGIVYYEGYSSSKNSEMAFDPLDDFGTPYAGATEIQYRENGKWETL